MQLLPCFCICRSTSENFRGRLAQLERLQVQARPIEPPISATLLLGHWYQIMALYYVKSILTERGVANAVTVGQNHFFLENKVVINFDFRSFGPHLTELRLSPNLAVKEQNERVYKCGRTCNFFCRPCKFLLP